jgi:hypothetical protein
MEFFEQSDPTQNIDELFAPYGREQLISHIIKLERYIREHDAQYLKLTQENVELRSRLRDAQPATQAVPQTALVPVHAITPTRVDPQEQLGDVIDVEWEDIP